MKKTLAAVAILGAFAGSALADVTVYGGMDMSMHWTHADNGTDKVAMESGNNETTMVGFKGSEKISDGLTAGFKLEAAFDADTGANTTHGLFKRESVVYLKGTYGEIAFGRTGSLDASTGSYAFMGSARTGFGGGYAGVGAIENVLIAKGGRLDNAVTYVSPAMAGVTVYAQVATAEASDETGNEFTQNVDRSYALGARYAAGAFGAGLVAKVQDYAQGTIETLKGSDDALVVSAYANYDFGVAKVFAGAQYFDGAKASVKDADAGYEGYGLTLAVSTPVCGGTAKAIVGYGEAEGMVSKEETTRWMVGAFYDYPLSKQTGLYAAAGYNVKDVKDGDVEQTTHGLVGVYHKF